MQSSKLDFLGKYNELVQFASNSIADFPNKLCDFIENEFELDAAAIFKINNNKNLELIGKSFGSKKTLTSQSQISCPNCKNIIENNQTLRFNIQSDCNFNVTDQVLNEGCMVIDVVDGQAALIKLAKKSVFTKNEIDNLELIAESVKSLLKLWIGGSGSLSFFSALVSDDHG